MSLNEINEKTRMPLVWVVGIVTCCVAGTLFLYELRRDVNELRKDVAEIKQLVAPKPTKLTKNEQ